MLADPAPTILVVDDTEPVRYATCRMLRRARFDVLEAENGTVALEVVRATHPDLVVLDVKLPDMSGFEVCRRIKSDPATSVIPVLHLSATYVDSAAKVIGLDSGADGYLTQPVSDEELLATVKALLRIKQAEEHSRQQAEEARAVRRELQQVLAALREKNHTLEALVHACPLAIMAVDREGRLTAWNTAAQRIFGWAEKEVIGRFLPTLPPDDGSVSGGAEELAGVAEPLSGFETVRMTKAGARIPVCLSTAPLTDAAGRLQGSIIVASDETSRKMADDALRRHEQLVSAGRMASALAHEINNPLSAVLNVIYLLRQRTDLDPLVAEYLSVADSELARVAQITNQVLAVHRHTPAAVEFRVNDILDAALSLYTSHFRRCKIELRRDYSGQAVVVSSPGEMRQVFSNLISNAVEALEKGGTLCLRVREWTNKAGVKGVRVSVADNGPGVPREIRNRIFEPFFTSKGEKGTGLGLWVVGGLIRKHSGSIRFRSATSGPRRGTCFTVFLPLNGSPVPFKRVA